MVFGCYSVHRSKFMFLYVNLYFPSSKHTTGFGTSCVLRAVSPPFPICRSSRVHPIQWMNLSLSFLYAQTQNSVLSPFSLFSCLAAVSKVSSSHVETRWYFVPLIKPAWFWKSVFFPLFLLKSGYSHHLLSSLPSFPSPIKYNFKLGQVRAYYNGSKEIFVSWYFWGKEMPLVSPFHGQSCRLLSQSSSSVQAITQGACTSNYWKLIKNRSWWVLWLLELWLLGWGGRLNLDFKKPRDGTTSGLASHGIFRVCYSSW